MSQPTYSPKELGALIRSVRKDQGMRQDQLAGMTAVGTRFIVDLEAGKPTVQLGKVLKVLAILGCGLTINLPPPSTGP